MNNKKVAVKIEPSGLSNPRLLYEYKIYKMLEKIDGFPEAYGYFCYNNRSNIEEESFNPLYNTQQNRLVLELLGNSLEKTFQDSHKIIDFKDIFMIAIQITTRIQKFHEGCC